MDTTRPSSTSQDPSPRRKGSKSDAKSESVGSPTTGRKPTHPAWACLASALMLVIAYEPVGAWWLVWVALVPFLLVVRSKTHGLLASAFGAWLGGLAFWLIAVEWVRSSDPTAWTGWLALAIVLSLWWPAFLIITRLLTRHAGIPMMLAAPAAWVSLEFLRAYHPLNGFQWFYLSQSLYRQGMLIQICDLAGAWGLSFLIVMVNACVVNLLTLPLFEPTPNGPRLARPQRIRAGITVGAILLTLIYGTIRTRSGRFEPGPRLALLQSDFPQVFNAPPQSRELLDRFAVLSRKAMTSDSRKPPDLIVWPETMFPYGWVEIDPALPENELLAQIREVDPQGDIPQWIQRRDVVSKMIHDWTDQMGVPMLVGINTHHFQTGGKRYSNAALLVQPGSQDTQSYSKLHLVPFGEYVPLIDSMPWILGLTPFDAEYMPNLTPADQPATLDLGPWKFGVLICFEDSVPQVARAVMWSSDRSPDLLLNLSNDGWFRGTSAHRLHLANSVLRAVEFRVPVARAVNTGISALIDGNGAILAELPPMKEDVLHVDVPLDPRKSVYATWGPWLPWVCVGISGAGLAVAAFRSWRSRRPGVQIVDKPGATGAAVLPNPSGELPAQS